MELKEGVPVEIKNILNDYSIGNVISISKPQHGSNNTYIIETDYSRYVLKANQRIDFLEVQNLVNKVLCKNDMSINRIISTRNNKLFTNNNYALYEYLEGDVYSHLSKEQIESALIYTASFNEKLRIINIEKIKFLQLNIWDKCRSINYIKSTFEDEIKILKLPIDYQAKIKEVISFVQSQFDNILDSNNQLIHSDLGADNFLFDGNQVIGIIDFTPEVENEYYSVSHFIYWNYLWNTEEIKCKEILDIFGFYGKYSSQKLEDRLILLSLIKASVSRLVGKVLYQIENYKTNLNSINKRLKIVITLINLYYQEYR